MIEQEADVRERPQRVRWRPLGFVNQHGHIELRHALTSRDAVHAICYFCCTAASALVLASARAVL